ncbi:MAG: hypothetical protein MUF51_08090 [Vicinamibacteria bacterium]|jgi:Tfp pilus assembly protein PilN|nr:hypothetical protein [Vicinamibacteria bacterium]
MIAPLNLASRPLRNELLPRLALAALTLIVVGATLVHGWQIYALLARGRASALLQQALALEQRSRQLRQDAERLSRNHPDQAALKEWKSVKALIDQRTLGWTRLLAQLEADLPQEARLISITPKTDDDGITLSFEAITRTPADSFEVVRAFERSEAFEDVFIMGASDENGETRAQYVMRYIPQPTAPVDKPSQSADAGDKAQ